MGAGFIVTAWSSQQLEVGLIQWWCTSVHLSVCRHKWRCHPAEGADVSHEVTISCSGRTHTLLLLLCTGNGQSLAGEGEQWRGCRLPGSCWLSPVQPTHRHPSLLRRADGRVQGVSGIFEAREATAADETRHGRRGTGLGRRHRRRSSVATTANEAVFVNCLRLNWILLILDKITNFFICIS